MSLLVYIDFPPIKYTCWFFEEPILSFDFRVFQWDSAYEIILVEFIQHFQGRLHLNQGSFIILNNHSLKCCVDMSI